MGSVDRIFLDQLVCIFQGRLAVHLQNYHLTLPSLTLCFKLGLEEIRELSCHPDRVHPEPVLENAAVL